MAKYDWKQLEKEYILSNYKSVSSFLRDKQIKNNGTTRKYTSGWKDKKRQKEDEKATKTIEKTIEKETEKEAQQIVDVKSIANDLALNIIKANSQLETHIVKSKSKKKTIKYDYQVNKIKEETIQEKEGIEKIKGTIKTKELKQLTSALKDIADILINSQQQYELKQEKLKLEKQKLEKDNW